MHSDYFRQLFSCLYFIKTYSKDFCLIYCSMIVSWNENVFPSTPKLYWEKLLQNFVQDHVFTVLNRLFPQEVLYRLYPDWIYSWKKIKIKQLRGEKVCRIWLFFFCRKHICTTKMTFILKIVLGSSKIHWKILKICFRNYVS